jgi:polyvinyl alcohol dehydrogenase (cytochrome)
VISSLPVKLASVVATVVAAVFVLGSLAPPACAQAPDGSALFNEHCAACHNGETNTRAPATELLRARSPEAILTALDTVMRVPGSRLSGTEKRAIAEFITGKAAGGDVTGAMTGLCQSRLPFKIPSSGPLWNGWGPGPTNTHFQPAGQAGLTPEQVPHLTLKWAFGFPDATHAWSQPSVVGGHVFVGSQNGTVYSLDAKTGCIYWAFTARAGVRTGITIGPRKGSKGFVAYFGDTSGNAYAVDASTGTQIWVRKLDHHPVAKITGTPTLYRDRLFVPVASYEEVDGASPDYACCTFRGSLSALNAKTGAVLWKTYPIQTEPKQRGKSAKGVVLWGPSGAAIWSSPTVDAKRGLVYAATGNSYSDPPDPASNAVLAFDVKSGKIRWTNQATPRDVFIDGCLPGGKNPNCPEGALGPDFDFGTSPILTKLPNGRDVIIVGQKSGVGFALDPDKQGAALWQYHAGVGSALGGIEWGVAADAEHAYFPVSDMFLPKPGGLHAVNIATGERAWFAAAPPLKCARGRGCNAAQSAAITVIPGVVFSGSVDGGIRAYSTKDGSIIWEYDTNQKFQTLNGVPANGASIIGPGPTVAGGMVYVNSGYGTHGGRVGNVLLAFGVE